MRRVGAVAALLLLVVVGDARPAAAHAELRSTTPVSGAVLGDDPPEEIVIRFTEPVEASLGAIRVYDEQADRLDDGDVFRPQGDRKAVGLRLPALERGGYVVTWRVVSADAHPIHGAFTFRVGPAATAGDDTAALARELLAQDGGDAAVGLAYAIARFAVFAGLVGLIGGLAAVLFLWPAGRTAPAAGRLLWGWWATAFVATALAIGLQGAHGAGLGLLDAFDPDVLATAVDTRYGTVSLSRLAVLVALGALLALLRRGRRPSMLLVGTAAADAVVLAATPGLAGHAATGGLALAAVLADTVHVLAVAVWLGGLAVVAVVVLRRTDEETVAAVVPRFSRVAFGAVAVVLATGVFQSWRQVRVLDAATETTYGRLLLVKLGLFLALVGAAAVSRRWVQARATTSHGLRRTVAVELGLAVAVLAVTALLVNAPPARTALAQPFSAELEADGLLVDVTVDPAKAGATDIHVYTLTPEGAVREVEEITLELTLASEGIGPIKVPTQRAGPGHFAAYGFDIPIAGRWELEAVVLVTDVDQVRATTTIPIR